MSFCRSRYWNLWSWWWKRLHDGFLPTPILITLIPFQSTRMPKPTYLLTTYGKVLISKFFEGFFDWIWVICFDRINLWHMEITDQSFNIVDIKPANMEELTEVITASEFHPKECNHFVYSSSKGTIRLCDMRQAALCDNHAKRESIFNFLLCKREAGERTKRVYNFSSDKIDRCIGLMKHFQSKHFFCPLFILWTFQSSRSPKIQRIAASSPK